MEWQDYLIDDPQDIAEILMETDSIAVLGIKPESRMGQPAHDVPAYMQRQGYEILPVPVYYPEVTEILGQPVERELRNLEGQIDVVNVFRRSEDVAQHLDALLAVRPKVVWMQLGIRNDEVAEALARRGIRVVQDRCILVDHRRITGR